MKILKFTPLPASRLIETVDFTKYDATKQSRIPAENVTVNSESDGLFAKLSYKQANDYFNFLLGNPENEAGISIEVSIDDISELEDLPLDWYPQKTEHGTVLIVWYWEVDNEEMYRLVHDFIISILPQIVCVRHGDKSKTYRIGDEFIVHTNRNKIIWMSNYPDDWHVELFIQQTLSVD